MLTIRCCNQPAATQDGHFIKMIPSNLRDFSELIQNQFRTDSVEEDTCFTVDATSRKTKRCGK